MNLYTLVHSLRMCASGNCEECHVANEEDCGMKLMEQAANVIEKFAETEDEFEDLDDGDWDREMGYDPYLGCYTDDC